MKLWSTNRRTLSLSTFAFLLLAFSVFTWGLGYKLSLYDPPQSTSHQMAKATLLSTDKDEQTTVAGSVLLSNPKSSAHARCASISGVFILCFLVLSSLGTPGKSHVGQDSEHPWRIRAGASFSAFFFRPPPIFS